MMLTPGIEGLGTTNVHGGKASYRRFSVGESEHLRRKDDDEVCTKLLPSICRCSRLSAAQSGLQDHNIATLHSLQYTYMSGYLLMKGSGAW